MKRIQLEIKALSPLAISRQKPGGSISECEDYIPGTIIRGAVAGEILKQSGQQFTNLSEDGGDFQALFLSDNAAIFQNAYPATLVLDDENFVIQEQIKVLPSTALSSKTKSGFKPENNGVFDTLIDRFCADSYGFAYEPNCPTDGDRVDTLSGSIFYSVFNDEYYKHSTSKRLLTRVGINRKRATSEDDILYSIEVLSESESTRKNSKPIVYNSSIVVPDDLADILWRFINTHCKNARLGGSTSRGLGKVEIKAKKPVDARADLKGKIVKFNKILRKRWDRWQVLGNPLQELPENKTYFTLNLQADAILTEQWRRTTVISAEMLQRFAEVEDKSLNIEAAYSSYDYRSGWNSAWGLMKDVELVTNKGGVYFFSTTQPDIWYTALNNLELKGVGERTYEGFGQIEVCNEFHHIFREEAV